MNTHFLVYRENDKNQIVFRPTSLEISELASQKRLSSSQILAHGKYDYTDGRLIAYRNLLPREELEKLVLSNVKFAKIKDYIRTMFLNIKQRIK